MVGRRARGVRRPADRGGRGTGRSRESRVGVREAGPERAEAESMGGFRGNPYITGIPNYFDIFLCKYLYI